MHPYNPYEFFPSDFAALAAKSEKLARLALRNGTHDGRKTVEGALEDDAVGDDGDRDEDGLDGNVGQEKRVYVDFQDAESSIALAEAMLEHDFGIHVSLRRDRLCPAIPNRINYVAWLQEILDETRLTSWHLEETKGRGERPTKRMKRHQEPVRILDIGTGASCIYPILGCALDDWDFIATDIDAESIEAARAILNDTRNQLISQATFTCGRRLRLQERIHLCLRRTDDSLLPSEEDMKQLKLSPTVWPHLKDGLVYHAVMCNPPFYRDKEEMRTCQEAKVQGPSAVCLGSESEMICEGGESAFVIRIIDESVHLKDRVLWFTSTLGKATDIDPIVRRLVEAHPISVLVTEFNQGRTKRWGIAWSFQPYRMDTPAWHSKILSLPVLGPYNDTHHTRSLGLESVLPRGSNERLAELTKWLNSFSLTWKEVDESAVVVRASSNSWNRAARRARMRGEHVLPPQELKCILCVRIVLDGDTLKATWMYGQDKATWDSFFSIVLQGWIKQVAALESIATVT